MRIELLKEIVTKASENLDFKHHDWYVDYHLSVVEKIALELLEFYPEADRELVLAMVWVHDYGKIVDSSDEYGATLREGGSVLSDAGYPEKFSELVLEYIGILDRSPELDLHEAPIEVRIVSSADGCAHMIGPFFHLYWWENPDKPFGDLMKENRRKLTKDWTRKIVLQEARDAFSTRYDLLREQTCSYYPDRFIAGPSTV